MLVQDAIPHFMFRVCRYPADVSARVRKYVELVFASVVLICALVNLFGSVARARVSYQLNYEEGNILNTADRILQGLSPYPDPHGWPSVINPYGPIPYYLVSAVVRIWGLSFFPSRLLIVLCTCLIAIVIAALVRRWGGSWLAGIAFAALYLCDPVVQDWTGLLRVDLIALLFTLAGLFVFATQPRRWWPSALLFVAALFCKYTMLAAPAACVTWLLFQHDWRGALRAVVFASVLSVAAFAVIQWATHSWFAFYMFHTHPDPFLLRQYLDGIADAAKGNALLLVLCAVLLVHDLRLRRPSVPLLYLLFSVIGAVTMGKAGSDTNHLLELTAATCLAAGAVWSVLWEIPAPKPRWAATALALLLAILAIRHATEVGFEGPYPGCEPAYAFVRAHPGKNFLSENLGAVVMAHHPLLISNPFVYTQLVEYGGWSDQSLQQQIRDPYYDLIIMNTEPAQEWSDEVIAALREHYVPVAHFNCELAEQMWEPMRPVEKRP